MTHWTGTKRVMMDGKSRTLAARLALAAGAFAALAGMVSAGHAEVLSEQPAGLVAAAAATGTPIETGPRFVPSGELALEDPAAFITVPAGQMLAAPIDAPAGQPEVAEHLGSGVASYYGRRFAGRPTASGERFDPAALTAAHRSLPFGSQVRVTNARNGKWVVVRINDRGPFHRGRAIDLSRQAAERIGIVAAGHGSVRLDLLKS